MGNLLRRVRRIRKVRKKIAKHTSLRLSVFRSNKHIYLQLLALNNSGFVLLSASSVEESIKQKFLGSKVTKKNLAFAVGELFAKRYKLKDFGKFVFDRSGFKYHGRVKEVVMALKKEGICF